MLLVLKALSSAAADTESLHSLQVQASVGGIKRDCIGTQECRIECPLYSIKGMDKSCDQGEKHV